MDRDVTALVIKTWAIFFAALPVSILLSARDAAGEDIKCQIHSSVAGKPAATPGQNVVLNCTVAAGRRASRMDWLKHGQGVTEGVTYCLDARGAGLTCAVLQIVNASAKDAGVYVCEARGKAGWDRSQILLHVFGPPRINIPLTQPGPLRWPLGSRQYLACEVTGYPAPNITWLYNNMTVRPGRHDMWHGAYYLNALDHRRLTLNLFAVTRDNQGIYMCRASNGWGKEELVLNVTVIELPKLAVNSDSQFYVSHRGENSTLTCTVTGIRNGETITAHWRHGSSASRGRTRTQTLSGGRARLVLFLEDVTASDGGSYSCGISSKEGTHATTFLVVVGHGLPGIQATRPRIKTTAGSRCVLNCIVTLPPRTSVILSWNRNGSLMEWTSRGRQYLRDLSRAEKRTEPLVPLKSVSKLGNAISLGSLGDSSDSRLEFNLEIVNVTEEDKGWYACELNTTLGSNSSMIYLTVANVSAVGLLPKDSSNFSFAGVLGVIALCSISSCIAAFAVRYLIRRKRFIHLKGSISSKHLNNKFKYDVFLTFSSKDVDWVIRHLTPLLDKLCLEYCIHTRDFEIGKAISENIADSVYHSRKVISIMSYHYMASKYCRAELDVALYRSTEYDDSSLIVIRVDDIPKAKLPRALRNRTFIDYNDPEERRHWEKRLVKYLRAGTRCSYFMETAF
ncbi:predicted protein [Nematostella vectensis]|uniref:Soluble interferon alpha/beta receptor OPG204 n=1 Tax=Nematostella vectensis TaxID=45351 RepID=A7RG80_NEMVE|nr:hemicentin-1 [Nematostella vectensis]EDO49483.1 predicted protein [Nematostella vectensis]|eukprot:XP_001641546.1 predicted protein [Nematostella vectensis]